MVRGKLLRKQIAYPVFFVIGFLFFFFWLTERDLAADGNILWTGKYIFRTLLISLLVGSAFGAILCAGLYRLAAAKMVAEKEDAEGARLSGGAVFGTSILLMFLGWFPAYLAYYPAICSYDSPIQVGQIGENAFIDHHPIAHTLLIKGAMEFGENVLGSVNAGIGVYSLLQLLMLAGVFAFGIARLYRHGVKLLWLVVLQAAMMFFPFNAYLSVCVTKDVIFSAFFVLQIISVYELLYKTSMERKITWREMLFFISTVGMILFRNNGKYAFLVFIVFLVPVALPGRERRKRFGGLLLWSAAGFLTGNIVLTGLFHLTGAEQGDKREMLSMPIQQLARCMIYHGGVGVLAEDDNTMDETDKALICDFILDEGYKEYDPAISDPVKRHTNTYVVRYRPGEFASSYFHLFSTYPGDFINAVLAVNAGYLYPKDVTHALVNADLGVKGMGYVQTRWSEEVFANYGIYKDSKWKWLHERMESWADGNGYLQIPVLKYLFMPGIWLWLYLIFFAYLMIRWEFEKCFPFILVLGYYGTLFLGPTVQLRYIYPVMIAFPFMILMSLERPSGS